MNFFSKQDIMRLLGKNIRKRLADSKELAIIAVPNHNVLEKLCRYFSVSRNIAEFPGCTYLYRVCCGLATNKGGSASPFVEIFNEQIFRHVMPNRTKNLNEVNNSTLASTGNARKASTIKQQLSSIEREFSSLQQSYNQLKEDSSKKHGKYFDKSEKRFMFAVDSDQESKDINEVTVFFMLLSDVSYLKNKLLKSRCIAVLVYVQWVLGRIREASSFLYLPKFSLTFNSFTR